jgi:hypothetical protein
MLDDNRHYEGTVTTSISTPWHVDIQAECDHIASFSQFAPYHTLTHIYNTLSFPGYSQSHSPWTSWDPGRYCTQTQIPGSHGVGDMEMANRLQHYARVRM